MRTTPFDMRRRQQFLYEDLYNKTRVNQFALINGGIENKKVADSTLENSSGHQFLYLEAFWIWMLDYTAGEPIAALAPRIADIVDKFEEWNKVDQFCQQEAALEFPEFGPYEYEGAPEFPILSDYQDTLQLLSIAILLRDHHSVKRIIYMLRSHRGRDGLFEQLIDGYVENGQALDTCIIGKPYSTLLQVFYEEDEKATLDLLQKYLKQWYPAMKNHPRWYDGHLRIRDEGYAPYYGYWAFEAGATVFLLDLDDSQIDHLVYPKDLVDYARQLRKDGRHTRLGTEPLIRNVRVEGGQPCPQTGFWETPAVAILSKAKSCLFLMMRHTVKPSGIGVKNNSQFPIWHSQRLAQRRAASAHEPLKWRAYAGRSAASTGHSAAPKRLEQGKIMSNLDAACGLTVWHFLKV